MFFNDGSVSEDICLHLSLEKVYVTELNTSLALFQVGPLHNDNTIMMMQSVLTVVLFVFVIALSFANQRCTEDIEELIHDVDSWRGSLAGPGLQLPGVQDSVSVTGLHPLKRESKFCRRATERNCDKKDVLEVCLGGLDVAVRYIPFFVEKFSNYSDDTVYSNIRDFLEIFNMTFKDIVGKCIEPPINNRRSYQVKCSNENECNHEYVVEGFNEWSSNVIELCYSVNETLEESREENTCIFESMCKKEERRRRKRADRKEAKEARRNRETKEEKRRRKEERKKLKHKNNRTSTPDCV